jgi:CheY-like chemotaxis protein
LGLASVLGILNAHGGVLDIQSTVQKGTHVSVVLPVSGGSIAQSEDVSESKRFRRNDEILIIDDDPTVLEVVARIVTFLGFTALPTASGQEALTRLEQSGTVPQCAIVDLTMPDMDGLETLASLRKILPELPVLLTTGYTTKIVPEEILAQKHTGFLKKPYSIRENLFLILAN